MRVSEHENIVSFLSREDWKGVALDFEAKFKLAATDLAAQADEIARLEFSLSTYKTSLAARTKALDTCEDQNEKLEQIIAGLQDEKSELSATLKLFVTDLEGEVQEHKKTKYDLARARLEIEALRPDAQKWRDYLKRSRDRKAGKKS